MMLRALCLGKLFFLRRCLSKLLSAVRQIFDSFAWTNYDH